MNIRKRIAAEIKAIDDLLDSPEKWTQRMAARDAHGERIHPLDEKASCFCLLGALIRVRGVRAYVSPVDETLSVIKTAATKVMHPTIRFDTVMGFNDAPSCTFADVKQVLAEAQESVA